MTRILIQKFVKDAAHPNSPAARQSCGALSGIMGIVLNLLLFAAKLIAGILSASISVTADALNNLSDAGSSVITLVGFHMAGKPADREHPFGHGRMEYVAGLMVSLAIMLMGAELARSSIGRILHPQPLRFSVLSLSVLGASILLKLWMAYFNRTLAGLIDSEAIRAVALDSLTDSAATLLVAAGAITGAHFGWNVDGWLGVLVALLILYSGFQAAGRSLSPLLGKAPDPEFIRAVTETVLSHEGITGMHDLIIHDYGPGRRILSLHAEMPCGTDVLRMHDIIDNLEFKLKAQFGCETTIHMDPVETDNPFSQELQVRVQELICAIDPQLSLHDFRVVRGASHTNLVFEVVVPHRFHLSDAVLLQTIKERVSGLGQAVFAVVHLERSYTPLPESEPD